MKLYSVFLLKHKIAITLLTSLSGLDFQVNEIVVDKPCKPLDILGEKIKHEIMEGEEVKEEEVRELVGDHLRFVGMIMEKGYEGAYRMWSRTFDKYKNMAESGEVKVKKTKHLSVSDEEKEMRAM